MFAGQISKDRAGTDRIDRHMRCQFLGQGPGHAENAPLRSRIGEFADPGRAPARMGAHRRDIDDPAGFLCRHQWGDEVAPIEIPLQIDREGVVPFGLADLQDAFRLGDAGIVHQHIDPAPLVDHLRPETLHRVEFGNLADQLQGLNAERLKGLDGVRPFGLASVHDRHIEALARQGECRSAADPPRAPGDDCGLPGVTHRIAVRRKVLAALASKGGRACCSTRLSHKIRSPTAQSWR